MRLFYLDASVLAKRYASENGSALVNEMMRHVPPSEQTCLTMGILELVSILVRKRNDGRLSETLFAQAMTNFKAEVIDNEAFSPVSVTDAQVLSALKLIEKHSLNATDAIVLGSVMEISQELEAEEDQLMLWTSDLRLARAAQAENISVFNPELETEDSLHRLLAPQILPEIPPEP